MMILINKVNSRLFAIFFMGLVILVLGGIGLKWAPGGVPMARLTAISFECVGLVTILLAWRDLDKIVVSPFWAGIQTKMAIAVHDSTTPEMDKLVEKAEAVPPTITAEERQRMYELADEYGRGLNPAVTEENRAIYAVMALVMKQAVIEKSDKEKANGPSNNNI